MKGLGPYWKKSRYKFRWKFDMADGLSECKPILVPPSNRLITSVFCVLRYPDKAIYILFTCNTLPIPYGIDAVPMCIWLWTRKKSTWTDEWKKLFYSHSSIQFKRFAKFPVDHRRKKMELCCCHGTDCFFAEKYFFQRIVSEIHLYLKFRERRKKNTCTSEWEISWKCQMNNFIAPFTISSIIFSS